MKCYRNGGSPHNLRNRNNTSFIAGGHTRTKHQQCFVGIAKKHSFGSQNPRKARSLIAVSGRPNHQKNTSHVQIQTLSVHSPPSSARLPLTGILDGLFTDRGVGFQWRKLSGHFGCGRLRWQSFIVEPHHPWCHCYFKLGFEFVPHPRLQE